MESEPSTNLPVIDQDVLAGVVRAILSNKAAQIESWKINQIGGGAGNPVSVGIYRVQGITRIDESEKAWSVILKVMQTPENIGLKDMGGGEDPTHWNYWKRELLVYRSGILDNLPEGLAAPACYAVEELPGNVARLWLEEIQDEYNGAWTLERYSLTARHLGRLNSMRPGKRTFPEYPWLGRDINLQWLQNWSDTPFPWDHPLSLSRYPEPETNPFIQLLRQNERFLQKLSALPVSLSHGDSYPTNFMSRVDATGSEQTVALDWALLGLQPLGYDLGQLVFGAINNLPDIPKEEIITNLFGSYIHGLRDEGCNLDAELVRYSFAVSAALRVGLFQLFMLRWQIEQAGDEITPANSSSAPDPLEVLMAREAFRLLEAC